MSHQVTFPSQRWQQFPPPWQPSQHRRMGRQTGCREAPAWTEWWGRVLVLGTDDRWQCWAKWPGVDKQTGPTTMLHNSSQTQRNQWSYQNIELHLCILLLCLYQIWSWSHWTISWWQADPISTKSGQHRVIVSKGYKHVGDSYSVNTTRGNKLMSRWTLADIVRTEEYYRGLEWISEPFANYNWQLDVKTWLNTKCCMHKFCQVSHLFISCHLEHNSTNLIETDGHHTDRDRTDNCSFRHKPVVAKTGKKIKTKQLQ